MHMEATGWLEFPEPEMKQIRGMMRQYKTHFTIHNRKRIVCTKTRGEEVWTTLIDVWDGRRAHRCLNPSCKATLSGAIPIMNNERRWDV